MECSMLSYAPSHIYNIREIAQKRIMKTTANIKDKVLTDEELQQTNDNVINASIRQ